MQALRAVRSRLRAFRQARHDFFQKRPTTRRMLTILFWLPTGLFVTDNLVQIKSIRGRSMQPTLNPDDSSWRDIVLFDRFHVKAHYPLSRGDIVALKSPADSKLVVKRVIALEGDVVKTLPPYPDAEVRVPEGCVWVEGDEPFRTEDSNRFGPVPRGLIESKLVYILWPWPRIGPLGKPVIVRRIDTERGSPIWRRQQAELEREKWRNSRVTIAPTPVDSTAAFP